MADYLATGFAAVDQADDPAVYAACLEYLQRHPFMRELKRESLDLLGGGPGARMLEVGCGLGQEARAMARITGQDGLVVALDASLAMLGRIGPDRPGPLALAAGDGCRLPFAADTFDACRVERTLQHLADPLTALAEMARVTRPGGAVLALEPDWGTLVVDCPRRAVTRLLTDFWCDSFKSGWIGRGLARGLAEAGLAEVAVHPRTLVLDTLAAADTIYDLTKTAARAVAAGRLTPAEAADWLAELAEADRRGRFFASLTFFMARGAKPAAA